MAWKARSICGTLAESYFRGFKRVENRGTYQTPLGDAAAIEILRGPPSPVYGAGKVGGLLNFIPKSENGKRGAIGGTLSASYGSYSRRNLTGEVGIPVDLGFARGGLYAYGELDDSYSYYRGLHPSRINSWKCRAISPPAPGRCPPITCITTPMAMCRRRAGTASRKA